MAPKKRGVGKEEGMKTTFLKSHPSLTCFTVADEFFRRESGRGKKRAHDYIDLGRSIRSLHAKDHLRGESFSTTERKN